MIEPLVLNARNLPLCEGGGNFLLNLKRFICPNYKNVEVKGCRILELNFRPFGLEDVKPQIGKIVVPIYEPGTDLQRSSDVSVLETVGNVLIEVLPFADNLLNILGEDYAETAFQRRLRNQ